MKRFQLIPGDSRVIARGMRENLFDSVVTDPPYHLQSIVERFSSPTAAPARGGSDGRFKRLSKGFMGEEWDGGDIAFDPTFWREIWRVLKPGGHLVAFGGPRTYHRLAAALEAAGFIIRDNLVWVYGQGFPKSHDISKALDRKAGAKRKEAGRKPGERYKYKFDSNFDDTSETSHLGRGDAGKLTLPATPEAIQWEGWGTALKPAQEGIALAQKPLSEDSFAANVLKWGVGALNIDKTRIGSNGAPGRWPANFIISHSPDCVHVRDEKRPGRKINRFTDGMKPWGEGAGHNYHSEDLGQDLVEIWACVPGCPVRELEAQGGSARFFYVPKPDQAEKNAGLPGKCPHPTVKPIALMRYLIRLVTPMGGLVYDPFMGSGTTGAAAMLEGDNFIGSENEPAYVPIAQARIQYWLDSVNLPIFQEGKNEAANDHPVIYPGDGSNLGGEPGSSGAA